MDLRGKPTPALGSFFSAVIGGKQVRAKVLRVESIPPTRRAMGIISMIATHRVEFSVE